MSALKRDSDLRSPANQLPNITEHLQSLKRNKSIESDNDLKECHIKLQRLETNIQWSPEDTNALFIALAKRFQCPTRPDQFVPWAMKVLHSIEINHVKPDRRLKNNKTITQLVSDTRITDDDLQSILSSETDKTLDEILKEIRQNETNQTDDTLLDKIKDIVSTVHEKIVSPKNSVQLDGLKKELFQLCEVVKETKYITPRLTQMVSWCLMALSESGWLIQVGTGEGKSCIVAMFAAFRARKGQKVDVLSSSPVLAERDMQDWKQFYKKLDIKVNCNSSKSETQKKDCYKCNVVYGTATDFAGDWLRHDFERRGTRGNRQFECVIVDEMDSLMIDNGLQIVYLSNEMPAMQHLNPLLALIWVTVNQYHMIDLRSAEERIKIMLRYTPCELSDNSLMCYVPRFLKDLVDLKLRVWIEKAFHAQTMTLGHEYIIEGGGVVPVDYSSTGVVQNGMSWSDGLQQFLEMKHLTRLSDMSVITNYMSNVWLLKQYKTQLYGISGTLGQTSEIETLKRLYEGIRICHIPLFKPRTFFEEASVLVDNEKEWIDKICRVVESQTKTTPFRGGRAVLVICETINRAETLHQALGLKVRNKTLYINNNMDNSGINKEHDAGDVIIATNLAGRGADLRVCDGVKTAGGLFVVLTFLPMNARVEQQAFGRSARQGAPGSAQLIVCSQHFSEQLQEVFTMLQWFNLAGHTKITLAKNARDFIVSAHLSSFLDEDVPKILKKEELFAEYITILEDLHKTTPHLSDSILTSLNETWGMWLLMNFNDSESSDDLKLKLRVDMQRARKKLESKHAPCSIIHHYTCLGNDQHKGGDFEESIDKYSKAIQEDHCWAAIALYNRSLARLDQENINQDRDCISQAMTDLEAALKSVEFYQRQISVTHAYSKKAATIHLGDTETRFDKHMKAKKLVLDLFKANITEAIQKLQYAARMGGNVKVEKALVCFMAPLQYLVPLGVLLEEQNLVTALGSNERKKLILLNDPSYDVLRELEDLKTLGLTKIFTLNTMLSIGGFFSKLFNL